VLVQIIEMGRLRAREVILGESHPETEQRGEMHRVGKALSRLFLTRVLAATAPRVP